MAKTEEKVDTSATTKEKKEDATTEETVTDETTETETEEGADEQKIDDIKKQLAKEQERRKKAEEAAAKNAFKARKQKREEKDDDEDAEEEEKPLTASELTSILAKERQLTQKEMRAAEIKEKSKQLATSETEAELIVEIHKNRTFPSDMSIEEQLEEAQAIANKGKLKAQNEELKRKIRSKETMETGGEGTHRDAPASGEPKMATQDVSAIKAAGFQWDGTKKLYKKSVGKKTLYYDPKTKKRFVQ